MRTACRDPRKADYFGVVSDLELLRSAWRELRGAATGITPTSIGSTPRKPLRAFFASLCPCCEEPIRIGDEIRRHSGLGLYSTLGASPSLYPSRSADLIPVSLSPRSPQPVRPALSVCPECHLEHAGECW